MSARDLLPVAASFAALSAAALAFKKLKILEFYSASANEWCLLIRQGNLIKSGIGLSGTALPWLGDVVVKFPSTLERVSFKAEQITQEVQGVRVSGFIVWTCFRDGQGPFRAYKNLPGLDVGSNERANESISGLAESIIRNRVANSSLEEVLRERDVIRTAVRAEMEKVCHGWGVWLETVEITDVVILSKSLFENLQTEFREANRLRAAESKASTTAAIDKRQVEEKLELDRQKQAAKLKLETEEAKLFAEKTRVQMARSDQKKQASLRDIQNEAEVRKTRTALKFENRMIELENEANILAKELQAQSARDQAEADKLSRKLSVLDDHRYAAALEIASTMYDNVKELKLVQCGPDAGIEGVAARLMAAATPAVASSSSSA